MAAHTGSPGGRLRSVDLELHPNEASDLAPVGDARLRKAHGWEAAFWTVLDEGAVERSIAVIARTGDGWEVVRPQLRANRYAGKTEDCEVCTYHDGWIYVIGSHYGSKAGPLEARRAWIARFREADFATGLADGDAELRIVKNRFRLHRAVNDGLRAFGPELRPVPDAVRERFIERTRRKAGKRRRGRINLTDVPINIEGAAFRPDGSLILGLRYPVSAGGDPILVELSGVDAMLEDERAAPVVRRFWELEGAGTRRRPVGVRALIRVGAEFHAIVGSLDSQDPKSVLMGGDGGAAAARCAHHRFRLGSAAGGGRVKAELVRRFPLRNVEGVAAAGDGRFLYVTDDDERVHLRYADG